MALTSARKRYTTAQCKAYRESRHDSCEVGWLIPVEMNCWLEVHHILGRGLALEHDNFTNLILIRKPAHDWDHKSPPQLEIACLYAKWKRFQKMVDVDETPDRLYWNPSALNVICDGGGLAGRIGGMLLPKVSESRFQTMAEELLMSLKRD